MSSIWVVIYRLSWVALGVICVAGMICAFIPECQSFHNLQRKKMAIEEENRVLETMIKEMQTKQEQFRTDPRFVERTAREMGMVKPNETLYKIIHDEPTNQPPAKAK